MTLDALNQAVRPLVTLALAAGLLYGFIGKLIGAEAYLSVVSVVIGFWFSQRQAAKNGPTPPPQPTS